MSSFSTGHNEVNLARRANIRRVNRVSNAGRAVICPHPFAKHTRTSRYRGNARRKKRINPIMPEEETSISANRDVIAIRDDSSR